MSKGLYSVYITPPGRNATPFGPVEASHDAGALHALGQLVRAKCAKQDIDPESKLELVSPDGRWLDATSQVKEHLTDG
ncbi:hypothetical protein [Novosphingobium sp. PC22D]|uniref:hypothetical protein n=1 Tax=Novosphingobium sp. PC22D TaxID=1962403 RepID=UPI0011454BDE|nr:hypothetical protein [Novosphingobium sp. PC22D]